MTKTYYVLQDGAGGSSYLGLSEGWGYRYLPGFVGAIQGKTPQDATAQLLNSLRGKGVVPAFGVRILRVEETTTTTEGTEERTVISEQEVCGVPKGELKWAVKYFDGSYCYLANRDGTNGYSLSSLPSEYGEDIGLHATIADAAKALAGGVGRRNALPFEKGTIVPVRVRKTPGETTVDVKVTELK